MRIIQMGGFELDGVSLEMMFYDNIKNEAKKFISKNISMKIKIRWFLVFS